MDYFGTVINLLYLTKLLLDIGKQEIVDSFINSVIACDGEIDYDTYYEAGLNSSDEVFELTKRYYNEDKCVSAVIMCDAVITDFYKLAGEYGKQHGIQSADNPYIRAAEQAANRRFSFSYNLYWQLKGCETPKYTNQSKLVLVTYEDDYPDVVGVAIGVAAMYQFFSDKCEELRKLLVTEEAIAA